MQRVVTPGATLGVLGSGQLGRMFAMAAARLGYRVEVYSPESDSPAGQVCARDWVSAYEDTAKLEAFAGAVDLVTFEFENIPAETAEAVERVVPVYPSPEILHIVQNRLREKRFIASLGLGVPEFTAITSDDECDAAQSFSCFPAILKTATAGYDGKGQTRVDSASELAGAWERLGGVECILERCIEFDYEASVIIARTHDGRMQTFPVFHNDHRNHILDVTRCPGIADEKIESQAREIAASIAEGLELVGLVCVELFVTGEGELLVNELAPRPHNSGHATLDCCITSQFEQLARAICGLPLGETNVLRPAAMVNLLGYLWAKGEPDWSSVLEEPDTALHLYGKHKPRPGRKMGHLTVLDEDVDSAARRGLALRDRLQA